MDKDPNQHNPSTPSTNQLPNVGQQQVNTPALPANFVPVPEGECAVRHAESVRRYPQLNLSRDECVIAEVHRTPIGLIPIWAFVSVTTVLVLGALPWYATNFAVLQKSFTFQLPSPVALVAPLLLICSLLVAGGLIATIVYINNIMYVTNESVIQFIRVSLFHNKQQTINLVNIEDASFAKRGIIQQLFNYGAVRLSTQGQHTTYEFHYTPNPRFVANAINDTIERALRHLESTPNRGVAGQTNGINLPLPPQNG